MKIGGKKIEPPKVRFVPLPRDDGDIVFHCAPVLDFTEFDELCPKPKAPWVQPVGKPGYHNADDPSFKEAVDRWGDLRTNWIFLKSLAATPNLEWDTVDMKNPETWDSYEVELRQLFTAGEFDMITMGVIEANYPTEERRREALERFFRSQAGKDTPENHP